MSPQYIEAHLTRRAAYLALHDANADYRSARDKRRSAWLAYMVAERAWINAQREQSESERVAVAVEDILRRHWSAS